MKLDTLISNLAELHEGQIVVHLNHGIGRYEGMKILEIGGVITEYLILIYEGDDKLYVPVSSLHLISPYDGNYNKNILLNKLGNCNWEKARNKVVEQIRDIAAEQLDIDIQRAKKNGFSFRHNKKKYKMFCDSFPFELTIDQDKAINEVLNDMCQPIAMDRIICGDAGFGKTEVAMRASFLAAENHKQVIILTPTALLAQQHFDNFRNRFYNWPIRIEMISRFRSVCDQTKILEDTAKGKIDILIGTHKLLQKGITWKNLGLLIIDEEHRFGVYHKERIKSIYSNIDILTLTATPIPRTLNMAINGLRDISIITTAPNDRLTVKTLIHKYDYQIVRKAILYEISRGGQVYYLYNDVKNINNIAQRIEKLVPEAKISVGHGQMKNKTFEQTMQNFYYKRFNVLVCTTIIEAGIDISNANTIIIEKAEHFGLAQLYQLRGRVGRSNHQAYAYFLTSSQKMINQDSYKRLKIISSLKDISAGFSLAVHDLEIRGAGELLGENQSGQIETIGLSLYTKLLKNAVNSLKIGYEPSLKDIINQLTDVELHIPALLPDSYISDINVRLSFYKRIASAENDHKIEELRMELYNRFGKLPDSACYLLSISSIKKRATILGIQYITGGNKGGVITFNKNNFVNPTHIVNLIKQKPDIFRLDGPNKLKFFCDLTNYKIRLQYIDDLLNDLHKNMINL